MKVEEIRCGFRRRRSSRERCEVGVVFVPCTLASGVWRGSCLCDGGAE